MYYLEDSLEIGWAQSAVAQLVSVNERKRALNTTRVTLMDKLKTSVQTTFVSKNRKTISFQKMYAFFFFFSCFWMNIDGEPVGASGSNSYIDAEIGGVGTLVAVQGTHLQSVDYYYSDRGAVASFSGLDGGFAVESKQQRKDEANTDTSSTPCVNHQEQKCNSESGNRNKKNESSGGHE